jgi:hypothetical protein
MKKTKIQSSMDEYISKLEDRMFWVQFLSIGTFMILSVISDRVFHLEILALVFLVMMFGAKIVIVRGLKRHIKNIRSLDQWRSGKSELRKELDTIQSHIQFLKSREAKATLPAEKIKELMASYTEAEKAALEGIERCDSIVETVQGHITGERLIQ